MLINARKVVALRVPQGEAPAEASHSEFALADLDYLNSPPSPIRLRLMATICALFASALILSAIAKIDIYATALARIQPTGRSKQIQSLGTGRISVIHVANGDRVKMGDPLVELDATESTADRETTSEQLDALRAEIARRIAADLAARRGQSDAVAEIDFDPGIAKSLQSRERSVLAADLSKLRLTLLALDARIAETTTKRSALQATIAEQNKLVTALQNRVDMWQSLLGSGQASKVNVIDAEQSLSAELTELAAMKGELSGTDAAIRSGEAEKRHALASFIAENTQSQATAQAKRDAVTQDLVKASARLEHTRLVSPIDGVVQELAVTTIGQVVTSGQPLMTVVPNDSTLEVEALLANKDIGFVEVGQPTVLKLDAFPFTRYGTITGKIARISHEAVASGEAIALANGSAVTTASTTSRIQTQDLVYPVTVTLDRSTIEIDNKTLPLLPGMTGKLEIRTGDRRALEYFLSPVLEVTSEAGHER